MAYSINKCVLSHKNTHINKEIYMLLINSHNYQYNHSRPLHFNPERATYNLQQTFQK